LYILGVGIYISKYNTLTSTWEVATPSLAADAARDDWHFLRCLTFTQPVNAQDTTFQFMEVPVGLKHPVVLGHGEALVAMADVNSNTINTAGGGAIYIQGGLKARISAVT